MVLEPVAAQVYFSPECHVAYAALGFSPSPATTRRVGCELPDGPAYFTSRGSVMGQVPGEVVAAAFAVFNPEAVVPSVEFGWSKVDAPTICAARTRGAVGQLERILGPSPDGLARATELLEAAVAPLRPEGKPLYAGLLGLGLPGDPLADAWRLADCCVSTAATPTRRPGRRPDSTPPRSGCSTEPYWGLPLRTYVRTRAWSDAQLDAAEARLVGRGLLADGTLTDDGRALRESIEADTDAQCTPMLDALGDDGFDELFGLLAPWGQAIRDAGGYPPQGPHDWRPRAELRRVEARAAWRRAVTTRDDFEHGAPAPSRLCVTSLLLSFSRAENRGGLYTKGKRPAVRRPSDPIPDAREPRAGPSGQRLVFRPLSRSDEQRQPRLVHPGRVPHVFGFTMA